MLQNTKHKMLHSFKYIRIINQYINKIIVMLSGRTLYYDLLVKLMYN